MRDGEHYSDWLRDREREREREREKQIKPVIATIILHPDTSRSPIV